MAISNGYCSLEELQDRLRLTGTVAGGQNLDAAMLESLITSASRQIDGWMGRRFYAATETRYPVVRGGRILLDQDLLSVTTLKTDEDGDGTYEVTWSSTTDYWLAPVDAATDGMPYSEIRLNRDLGRYSFPTGERAVQLVGSFGYNATGSHPAPIREACLRLAERLYKLRDAPLGVTGSVELGVVRVSTDRDLQEMLWPYRRRRGFA